jgi:hypothetical protein
MDDTGDLWSIDAARWGVETEQESGPSSAGGGWVRIMESPDRDDAIRRAREEKAKKPESQFNVVAVEEEGGFPIGRWEISTIPAT